MCLLQDAKEKMPKKRFLSVLKMYIADRFADALVQHYQWSSTVMMGDMSKELMKGIADVM